ncbi:hypothetical protein [Romboutsia sp.]|uniref:hypothetical protein n=1 Tax=Romboutsia sp. TaxID=1965302 RepID=UPI003F29F7FC
MELLHQVRPIENFTGTGEVGGFVFTKLNESTTAFLYHVKTEYSEHYEVFKKKISAICLDFIKKIFSETEFKYQYPKANDFGTWAWTYNDITKAIIKFDTISNGKDI